MPLNSWINRSRETIIQAERNQNHGDEQLTFSIDMASQGEIRIDQAKRGYDIASDTPTSQGYLVQSILHEVRTRRGR
jgi:hypothetical protein